MSENTVFYYRKSAQYNVFPGANAGKTEGNGLLFKQHKPLISAPDLRHIDLRASMLNPFSQYQVKSFQQQSRLDVFLLADLSASMGYQGKYNKQQVLVDSCCQLLSLLMRQVTVLVLWVVLSQLILNCLFHPQIFSKGA